MNTLELVNTIDCIYILGQAIGIILCFIKDLRIIGLLVVASLNIIIPSIVLVYFPHNYANTLQQFQEIIWSYPIIIFIFLPITIFFIRFIYNVFKI